MDKVSITRGFVWIRFPVQGVLYGLGFLYEGFCME